MKNYYKYIDIIEYLTKNMLLKIENVYFYEI